MNAGEVLRAAAARVRRGWWDGWGMKCTAGSTCAALAIEDECYPDEQWRTLYRSAAIAMMKAIGVTEPGTAFSCHIYLWNDAPGQTAENVAAGLEYAALLWDQEQAITAPAEQSQPAMVIR